MERDKKAEEKLEERDEKDERSTPLNKGFNIAKYTKQVSLYFIFSTISKYQRI